MAGTEMQQGCRSGTDGKIRCFAAFCFSPSSCRLSRCKRSSVTVNPPGVFRLSVSEGITRLTHLVDFGKAIGKLQTLEGISTK